MVAHRLSVERCGHRALRLGWTAILFFCGGMTSAATVDEIQAAWVRHAAAIESIDYQCDQTWIESIHKEVTSNDPFDTPVDPKSKRVQITKSGTISFAKQGSQAAFRRHAEQWDHPSRHKKFVQQEFVFDGRRQIEFGSGPQFGLGHIEDAAEPPPAIISSVELWPVWLTHWPHEQLRRNKLYDPARIEITNENAECDGSPCIELTLRSTKKKQAAMVFYVDPAKDFRIVKLVSTFNGEPRMQYDMKLEPDQKIGWRLSKWRTEWADDDEPEGKFVTNVVKKCAINEPIDDAIFSVKFPVGTHVHDNGRYFIQETEESRREISLKEFGVQRGPQGKL